MDFLIGYRDENRKVHYYHGMNGQTGRAVCGTKIAAPRFDEQTGGVILKQLTTLDNRGWQMVQDADRCRFS